MTTQFIRWCTSIQRRWADATTPDDFQRQSTARRCSRERDARGVCQGQAAACRFPRVAASGRRSGQRFANDGTRGDGHAAAARSRDAGEGAAPHQKTSTMQTLPAFVAFAFRSTCGGRFGVPTRRTPAWRSTSAGRWTATPEWIHRSTLSTCAPAVRRS